MQQEYIDGSGARNSFQREGGGFFASRTLTKVLMVVYLAVLVWIILFKMQFSFEVMGTMRSVNLIPLAGSMVINGVPHYAEVVQNLLVFVPLGMYAAMLLERRPFWLALVLVVGTTLALETTQYVFAMGASDITDILSNTAGGLVGYGMYRLVRLVAKSDTRARRFCNALALVATALIGGFLLFIVLVSA